MEVRTTEVFDQWFDNLRDPRGRAQIQARIRRLELGNPGDHKALTGGFSELRFRTGPAYRIYYIQRGGAWILLLCGGDKASQKSDIKRAQRMAAEI